MADELNLLPCPFCESPANLLLDEDDCPYVACASCHISQPAHRPGFEHMAIAAWNRRAAPAAAQLDADLPLLNDEQIEMLWAQHADTAKAGERRIAFGRAVEQKVRAQYAERIRLLTEELEAARGMVPSQMKVPGQSIGNDREFERLMVQWWVARESGGGIEEWRKAIAYIDGRTASTAAPKGYVFAPAEATEAMVHAAQDLPPPRMFGVVYRSMLAAAPSPLSGTEEAK